MDAKLITKYDSLLLSDQVIIEAMIIALHEKDKTNCGTARETMTRMNDVQANQKQEAPQLKP